MSENGDYILCKPDSTPRGEPLSFPASLCGALDDGSGRGGRQGVQQEGGAAL